VRRAGALLLVALAACGPTPAPRGRYTLVSVDGRRVPISGSFYTPAVGFRADLLGGDLLVCTPTMVVRTDRVREQNEVVPTDDPRAHPKESWHTEPLRLRVDGRRVVLAFQDSADRRVRVDTGVVSGRAGDTITVEQHGDAGAPTRRYLFVRAPGDTTEPGHDGTLCGNYM
jgi:hypothetical protein